MSNTFTVQNIKEHYDNYMGYMSECQGNNPQTFPEWLDELYKPTKKVIDLSVLVESGIDCEFSDNSSWEVTTIGKLYSLDTSNFLPYVLGSKQVSFKCVRPRMNHKHAWQDGECPLPEGFIVRLTKWSVHLPNIRWIEITSEEWINSSSHQHTTVQAFEVLGLADGYVNALGARRMNTPTSNGSRYLGWNNTLDSLPPKNSIVAIRDLGSQELIIVVYLLNEWELLSGGTTRTPSEWMHIAIRSEEEQDV